MSATPGLLNLAGVITNAAANIATRIAGAPRMDGRRIQPVYESFGEGSDPTPTAHTHPYTGDIPVSGTVAANRHVRSGVTVDQDADLIPFDELMRRLNG